MKTSGKIYILLTCAIMMAWLLPWLYNLCTPKTFSTPFTLYSCILDDFTTMASDGKDRLVFKDRKGNLYRGSQFDSVQPMFYNRQLLADGKMPDSIKGRAITAEEIKYNNFFANTSAYEINRTTPELYMLMESLPKRVDFEEPEEVFRSTSEGLEILDMASNSIKEERSMIFTEAMKKKGFSFPIQLIHGNATTQKQYDEGYFMTDSKGGLFHMKQTNGRPYVKHIEIPQELEISNIIITEFPNRQTRAYLSDKKNRFFILDENYKIYKTDVIYNPFKDGLLIIGDMFYYTVKVDNDTEERFYALDSKTYATVDTMNITREENIYSKVSDLLFPVRLKFTSYDDRWVYPRLLDWSASALILNFILAAIFLHINRKRLRKNLIMGTGILILGIYLFIPVLVIKE